MSTAAMASLLALTARSARAFVRPASGLAPRRVGGRLLSTQSSNSFELEGVITKIGDVQTFDSGFRKCEFILTTSQDMYPQEIKFELLKDNIDLIDRYAIDQRVCVSFNIRGNEWQGRHFVNLQCWRLQDRSAPPAFGGAPPPVVASSGSQSSSPFGEPFSSFDAPAVPEDAGKGDLPF
mmetsp:Transcript_9168/g.28565  ORF Transcript_9168/g.28565 Transcript_9168/m.28565 type:complete len:179 (+) Transcript_9168:132-668(+)